MASASGGTDYGPFDNGSRYRNLDCDFPPIQKKQRKRIFTAVDPRTGFVLVDKVFGEFYVMKNIDKSASFEKVSPFFINKALNNHIGDGHVTKRIRDGSLLIKCKNDIQTQKLINLDQQIFGNTYKVSVAEHTQLNSVQGLVYCYDAKFLSEDEIREGLQDEKVIDVQKIKKKVNGVLTNTALCILTFKRSVLPTSIHFGFHEVLVKQYIPNPLRCLNCFRFGHSRKTCKNDRVCANCSESFHEPNECSTPTKCVNCQGNHNNWNKNCPRYVRESGIQKIKTQEKISYFEAKKKFVTFYPRSDESSALLTTQSKSYAQATASATTNTQSKNTPVKRQAVMTNTKEKNSTEIRSPTITNPHKSNKKNQYNDDNTNMVIPETHSTTDSQTIQTEQDAHSCEQNTNEVKSAQLPLSLYQTRSSYSLSPTSGAIRKTTAISAETEMDAT